MKILSIKKKNAFLRFFGIEDWIVEVEQKDGTRRKVSAWAGGHSTPYEVDSLLSDLEGKTGEPYFSEYLKARFENRVPKIEGLEKAYLAVENKNVHAVGGTITIGVQGGNQVSVKSAAQIQQSLRGSTSAQIGNGIKRGK